MDKDYFAPGQKGVRIFFMSLGPGFNYVRSQPSSYITKSFVGSRGYPGYCSFVPAAAAAASTPSHRERMMRLREVVYAT